MEPGSIEAHLSGIRQFVTKRLGDLQRLLSGETSLARVELKKHLGEIPMIPQYGKTGRITWLKALGICSEKNGAVSYGPSSNSDGCGGWI